MASNMSEMLFHRTTLVIFSVIWFLQHCLTNIFVKFGIISPIFWLNIPKTSSRTSSSSYLIIYASFDEHPHVEGVLIRKISMFTGKWFRFTSHFSCVFFGPAGPALLEWIPYPPPALGVTEVNKNPVPQQSSPLHLNSEKLFISKPPENFEFDSSFSS